VLSSAVDSSAALFRHAYGLLLKIAVKPDDIRGIGIHLKKLPECNHGSGKSIADMLSNNQGRSNVPGSAQLAVFSSNSEDDDDYQNNDIEGNALTTNIRGKLSQRELAYVPVSGADRIVDPIATTEIKFNKSDIDTSQHLVLPPRVVSKKQKSSSPPGGRSITTFFKKISNDIEIASQSQSCIQIPASKNQSDPIDPTIFAALPVDIRLELQSAGFRVPQQQQDSGKPVEKEASEFNEMCAELKVDPTFLAALPEDIRLEQLEWMRQGKRRKIS